MPPMPSRIGYYVHHHGTGHQRRFEAIHSIIGDDLVAISQLDMTDRSPGAVNLPSDTHGTRPVDPTADGALHWAPLDAPNAIPRFVRFSEFLDDLRPVGVVVDVSVEAALTCRLAGVPVVYVRQHGDRSDSAHQLAYRSARRLLAPWPVELEDPETPTWVVSKTDYVGYLADAPSPRHSSIVADADDIVLVSGTGGGALGTHVASRVAETTGRRVYTAGAGSRQPGRRLRHGEVIDLGWTDRLAELLERGPIVVATAGNSTIALAATSGCALVTTPRSRPFDEQLAHARRLDAVGAAVCVEEPESIEDWKPYVDLAEERRGALRVLARPGGPTRAAQTILETFVGFGDSPGHR